MINKKIYHAAIYVRLSKEDGDAKDAKKAESNSISNQKNLIKDFLKDKEGNRVGYPRRTFSAGSYLNGYSDHFPTEVLLVRKVERK